MSLRRLLLLAAVLVLAQLGGLLHGLSHLGEHDRHEDGGPHAACEWCLAYAALEQGLSGPPAVLPVPAAPPSLGRAMPRPLIPHTPLPYRSRAPPRRLV